MSNHTITINYFGADGKNVNVANSVATTPTEAKEEHNIAIGANTTEQFADVVTTLAHLKDLVISTDIDITIKLYNQAVSNAGATNPNLSAGRGLVYSNGFSPALNDFVTAGLPAGATGIAKIGFINNSSVPANNTGTVTVWVTRDNS